jgi:hypothetical protein
LKNVTVSDAARLNELFDHRGRGVSNIQAHPPCGRPGGFLGGKKEKELIRWETCLMLI